MVYVYHVFDHALPCMCSVLFCYWDMVLTTLITGDCNFYNSCSNNSYRDSEVYYTQISQNHGIKDHIAYSENCRKDRINFQRERACVCVLEIAL